MCNDLHVSLCYLRRHTVDTLHRELKTSQINPLNDPSCFLSSEGVYFTGSLGAHKNKSARLSERSDGQVVVVSESFLSETGE